MGVEANLIFNVGGLEEPEAQRFFSQVVRNSDDDVGPNFPKIGEEIVRRCNGLPMAIKTIATTLRDKRKDVWKDALYRLEHQEHNVVDVIFEISYENIREEETKQIFLLCGLFPDDFDIPIEDLLRYAWGLRLLEPKHFRGARYRLNTCVVQLIHANLLIKSDRDGCVKMHDLVLDFVLRIVTKGDHAWIINHGDMSNWSRGDMSESCTRISLSCTGVSEFPRDFKYPNLSLLKLMNGDESLRFSEDFYGKTEKLEVIACENMKYPLLPRSLECSTSLRTLCLHQCSLMLDCSSIGEILNLEVLSFAHSKLQKLPSTIGNLKELKLLDLTGCGDLCIDDGLLKNLVKLEELYMKVGRLKAISFTDGKCNELAKRSKNLSALEIEFFKNNVEPKNMSFKKLERFKISVGRCLKENTAKNMHSFENTLMLVTNKGELLESRMNELFEKTEVLYLEVNDMSYLKDVLVEFLQPLENSFYNLRVLDVFKCANLTYLFTVPVASGLTKLERLTISLCPVLKKLVHSENNEVGAIKFQELKFLSLIQLPELESLCNIVNVIELPQLVELRLDGLPNFTSIYPEMSSNTSGMQPFLNKEVVIPMLEKLHIYRMKNLKDIWPCQFSSSEEVNISMLREIRVSRCDSLVNLFPSNPLPLLHHLEYLQVDNCGSIEVLFNIDLGCVHEIEEGSSKLRHIEIYNLGKLREIWRMKHVNNSNILIRGFQAVESLKICGCRSFRNIFTPTTTNFDLGALTSIMINGGKFYEERSSTNELVEYSQEVNVISKEEKSEVDDNILNVAFPSYLLHTLHHLQTLTMKRDDRVEVVFEMESAYSREVATTRNNQQPLLPCLKDLHLENMKRMSHVWKCNWNKFLVPQQQLEFAFHDLTKIHLEYCHNIKYLFSPLIAKLLSNLKIVKIARCVGFEEVVSNRDDEDEEKATSTSSHTNTTFFPHLDILDLYYLPRLKRIDGGGARGGSNKITSNITCVITSDQFQCAQVTGASWSLCQYPRKISISNCNALSSVIPSCAIGQMQKLEKLEIRYCNSMMEVFETQEINNNGGSSTNVDKGSGGTGTTLTKNVIVPKLPNLNILGIYRCDLSQHVFTFSTLEIFKQLKKLMVEECKAMQVIVKEENGEHTTTSKFVVFPRLESLELVHLPNLKGFFFQWPLLDDIKMGDYPQTMVFNNSGGSCTNVDEGSGGTGTILAIPRQPKLSNLKKLHIINCDLLPHIFTFSTLESLTQLQELTIKKCKALEVIVMEDGEHAMTSKVVVFPCLQSLELVNLPNCKGFFLGMNDIQWPLLDKVKIDDCPQMMVFTSGKSTTPKLEYIHKGFGKYSLECGLNFHVTASSHQTPFPSLDCTSSCPTTSEGIPWSFPNLIEIDMKYMKVKKIPSNELLQLQKLKKIDVKSCYSLEEVFEVKGTDSGFNESESVVKLPNLREVNLWNLHVLKYIWKSNQWTVLEFPYLTRVSIDCCNRLEHVFTCSMVGSLLQLQELHVSYCKNIEVIVKEANVVLEEEKSDAKVKEIILPRLKSLKLEKLESLKGFCLGMEAFSWPSLDTLEIKYCPEITVFTKGRSATSELKRIDARFGMCYVREDLNSFIKTKQQEGFKF